MEIIRGYLPLPENFQYTTKDDLEQCKKRIESTFSFNQAYRLISKGTEFQIVKIEPDQFFLKQLENVFARRITIRMEPGDGITLLHCEAGIPKLAENRMRIAAGLAILLGIVPLWLGYGLDNPSVQQACRAIFIGFVVIALSIYFYARNRQNSEQDELRNILTKLMIDVHAHEETIPRKPFPLGRFVVTLLILAFVLSWWFGGYVYDAYQSQSWVSTQGTISDSTEVKKPPSGDVDKDETHYVYDYAVSNQPYVSTRYALEGDGDYLGSPGPYKVGEKVVVYYNPNNPQQALLKRTKFRDACNSLIIPVIIMAFAIMAVISTRTLYLRRNP